MPIASKIMNHVGETFAYIRQGSNSEALESRKEKIELARSAKNQGLPAQTIKAVKAFLEADVGSKEAAEAEKTLSGLGKRNKFVHRDADLHTATECFKNDAAAHKNKASAITRKRQKHTDQLSALSAKAEGAGGLRKKWLSHRAERLGAKAEAYLEATHNPLDVHVQSEALLNGDAKRIEEFQAARSGEYTPQGATKEAMLESRLKRAETREGRADARALQHAQWGTTQAAHKFRKTVLASVGRHLDLSGHYAALHGAQLGRAAQVAGAAVAGAAIFGAVVAVAPIVYTVNQLVDNAKNINRTINPFTASKKTVHQRQALQYFESNPHAVAGAKAKREDVKAWLASPKEFQAKQQAAKEHKDNQARLAAESENGALEKELEQMTSTESSKS